MPSMGRPRRGQPLKLHLIRGYRAAICTPAPRNLERSRIVDVVLIHRHIPDPYVPGRRGRISQRIGAPSGILILPHWPVQQSHLAEIIPDLLARLGFFRSGVADPYPRRGARCLPCGGCVRILQRKDQEPYPGHDRG